MRLLLILWSACALAQSDPALDALQREWTRLARVANGVVGATVVHLQTGRSVSINASEGYPMASTVKVPLAVQLLSLVDEGKLTLDQMVTLRPQDLHPGSGTLSDLFRQPGVALSVRNLMELMLLISDNSATDVLLRLAGGADAVNARLRTLGIAGIRVDRSTALLIADAVGYRDKLPPEDQWTLEAFPRASRQLTPEQRRAANQRFQDDPRDTATPTGMAQLLSRIYNKDLFKPETAELLLDILRRCRTGEARLKGLLPRGTTVAHKTGSMPMVVNDVGIITLPDQAGHLALAAFTKKCENAANAERAIAELSRSAHDFFLFHPKAPIDYEKLSARVVGSLKPQRGEKYFIRAHPGYFQPLIPSLKRRLGAAGAEETRVLDEAQIYLWLPLQPGGSSLSPEERAALKTWTDKGGSRRQIHFHWGEGSVYADGLYGQHSAALDALYQDALDIDYAALATAQDGVIAKLRSGVVRVRTPHGTDISFRTGNRPFNKQDGDASAARMRSARMRIDRDIELPAGVVRVAPVEDSASGIIVIPEARFGVTTAHNVKLTIRKGRVVKVEAQENLAAVEDYLKQGGEAAYRFREFAIGMNPKLQPASGSMVLPYYGYGRGVVRLSLGDNEELGGSVRGGFTRWFFFPDATVTVNNQSLPVFGSLTAPLKR